jgi:two-component system LytT family response regulator
MNMAKYRVLIVDDEPLARRGIRMRLKSYPDFTIIDECENGLTALEVIREQAPDLVFLDIQMPVMNGFEMLARLPNSRNPFIVFLTAFDQYALKAFEVHALDYLLKPIDGRRFNEAMKRARHQLELADAGSMEGRLRALLAEYQPNGKGNAYQDRFAVQTGSRITFVLADEIDWIEAVGDYAGLHVGKTRPLLREGLSTLETRLDPKKFVRIHRRSIVQISRIRDLQKLPNRDLKLRLIDGTNLRVSRTYRDRLDQLLPLQ